MPFRDPTGEIDMGILEWVAVLLTAGLLLYLAYVLVFPEQF